MRHSRFIFAASCMALLHGLSADAASYALDGGTTGIVIGDWDIPTTDVFIGTTTPSNSLLVSSSGVVSNNSTYVGYGTGANANRVELQPGARWFGSGNFEVGSEGSSNSLLVEAGAVLETGSGYVGREASAASNSVVVSGTGSRWSSSNYMRIGHHGSGNSLEVADGGLLENELSADIGLMEAAWQNRVLVTGSNSLWRSGQRLAVGYAGAMNSLSVEAGGRVETEGLYVGYLGTATGNTASVSGEGSAIISSDPVVVGLYGSDNSLAVVDGGSFQAPDLVAGVYSGAQNNRITVDGENSVLSVTDSLMIGGAQPSTGGTGNRLIVLHGGRVAAGDLYNRNSSEIWLGADSRIETGNYYQDSSSALRLDVTEDETRRPQNGWIDVAGTAEFERDATIQLLSNIGELEFNRYYTNRVVSANTLVVDGKANADTEDLEKLNAYGTLLYVKFYERDQDIVARFSRKRLAEAAGFEDGTMMARVADRIDDIGLSGGERATTQVMMLNEMPSGEIADQMRQLYAFGVPTHRHMDSLQGGLDAALERGNRFESGTVPEGAAGPGDDRRTSVWFKAYAMSGDQDATGGYSAFDHYMGGLVLGCDKRFEKLQLGAAAGFATSNIHQDNGDTSDARTAYAVLYGSRLFDAGFLDGAVSLGRNRIDNEAGTRFDTTADILANSWLLYMGGGRNFGLGKGWIATPEFGLRFGFYDQRAYGENSTTAEPRHVDEYDRWSTRFKLGTRIGRVDNGKIESIVPRGRLFWFHEFRDEDDSLGYTLGTSDEDFTMQIPGTDTDLINVGVGLSAMNARGWELILDIDGYMSAKYTSVVFGGRISRKF
ncbi:autotransporter domain-containing protein [Pontiella sp.]|uniref:autotransporter family protein n=1 Tax=Pontiella sp. TaxID=2837462 RepID=UPI0035633E07